MFVPLSFLPGQTGRLFREFGFTLAIAVALSAVVALTLAPMLASRMLKEGECAPQQPAREPRPQALRLLSLDAPLLPRNPLLIVVVAVLFAGSAYLVFGTLRQELTPAGGSLGRQHRRQRAADREPRFHPHPDAEDRGAAAAAGRQRRGRVDLLDLGLWLQHLERQHHADASCPGSSATRSQQQIAAEVQRARAGSAPGVRISTRQGNSLGIRGGGSGMQFAVVGPNYDELAETAHAIADAMEEDPRFGRVNVNYNTTQPQLTLTIDREKAAALGIDINGLATTMQAMIDGAQVGNVFINDESFTVRMVSTTSPVNDPGDLESIFLKTADDRYVPMSTIATLTEAPIAPSLGREEQRRAVNVSAALDGLALGDAWTQAQAIAAPLLPEGTAIIPMAETKTIGQANNGLLITFGFALIVILLVLAAQFESVWSAIIVMATVPFGLACAVYALLVTGVSLNVYSQIGLILLVGIMAKNGILIVEFANQLRDRGLSVRDAIEEASNIRLRPVLMTMIATVLGGVPLVISSRRRRRSARSRSAGSSSAASALPRSRRCT